MNKHTTINDQQATHFMIHALSLNIHALKQTIIIYNQAEQYSKKDIFNRRRKGKEINQTQKFANRKISREKDKILSERGALPFGWQPQLLFYVCVCLQSIPGEQKISTGLALTPRVVQASYKINFGDVERRKCPSYVSAITHFGAVSRLIESIKSPLVAIAHRKLIRN